MRGTNSAALLSLLALVACASDPVLSRVEVQRLAAPGLSGGFTTVEALRTASGWSVTHKVDRNRPSVRWLNATDAARLDAALASGALDEKPTEISGGCLDPDLVTIDISAGGVTRRLVLECQSSPGIEAVLAALRD